jgi:hypothetical protein
MALHFPNLMVAAAVAAGLAGCNPTSGTSTSSSPASDLSQTDETRSPAYLPLRIPISAVMTGIINRSSYEIFRHATSVRDPSDSDWLGIAAAAVDLVGAATLVTIPGPGPQDPEWTASSDWMRLSVDMQAAALAVGAAASGKNRVALTESAARLAQSCQSCHLQFSPRLATSPPAGE